MFRKYGRIERTNRKRTGQCIVPGCEFPDDGSLGLCHKHYMRQWYYGTTDRKTTGEKRSHPHYMLWFDRKSCDCLADEWLNFERFIADIGEKPAGHQFLVRLDGSRPYGPDNFKWQEHLKRRPGEPRKEWWARKWAARQAANPGMERRRDLRRRFGMTTEQHEDMVAAHGGKCAICGQAETAVDPKTGTVKRLCVDHCHTTKKVRGLLCFRCNSTIGRIGENLALLDAMRAYLVRHNGDVAHAP